VRSAAVLAVAALAALAGISAIGSLTGCPAPRDVVPDSRDQLVPRGSDGGGGGGAGTGAYAWVAKRAHGAIGVAGARNLDEETARAIVERLADDLEACARRLESQGSLVDGAARYVAAGGPRGAGEIGDMQLAPGSAVAANALLCLVAPVRAATFPAATDGGVPALLLEATWGPVHSGKATTSRDAGAPLDAAASTNL
jgi:hypothetical protein